MSRAPACLVLAVAALLGAAGQLHAQQPPQGSERLEALRAAWAGTTDEYTATRAAIDAGEARLVKSQAEHDRHLEALRAAEQEQLGSWTPWGKVIARRAVEQAKQGVRAVADQLGREKHALDGLRQREGVLRLELIQTGRQLVERLIGRADGLRLNGRGAQADGYYAEAVQKLAILEDLEAVDAPPAPPPALPDLEEETRGRTAGELEQLAEFYAELQREAERHVAGLQPDEKALAERLEHLNRLLEKEKVAIPTLPERRERAARALSRVATLRQALETRAARYRTRVGEIKAAAERRAAEESQRARGEQERREPR